MPHNTVLCGRSVDFVTDLFVLDLVISDIAIDARYNIDLRTGAASPRHLVQVSAAAVVAQEAPDRDAVPAPKADVSHGGQ